MAKKTKAKKLSFPLVFSLFITLVLVISIVYAVFSLKSETSVTESDAYGSNLVVEGLNLAVFTPVSVAKGKPFQMSAQFRVPKVKDQPELITSWHRLAWYVDVCGTKYEDIREDTNDINMVIKGVMPRSNVCPVSISVAGTVNAGDDNPYPGGITLNMKNVPNSLVINGPSTVSMDTRPEFTSSWEGSDFVKTTWTWGAQKCSPTSTGSVQTQARFTPIITKMPGGGNCPITLKRQLVTGKPGMLDFDLEFATGVKTVKVVN